jgi:multiple sugar transport system substrate-binding protein
MVSCSTQSPENRGEDPTSVVVWHYYNGVQKQLFDELVTRFNETEGEEKNIVVEAANQGAINDLAQKTLDALQHKVGALEAPDVFAAYSDTVDLVRQQDMAVDISAYLTQEERSEYLESYLSEGDLDGTDSLYIFPIAKATEVLMLNFTDWLPFAKATGAQEEDFATWEGIGHLAEKYYRWTDSLTETPEDGKAFFGRDAMANYLLVGCAQAGHELFGVTNGMVSLRMDEAVMRRLWDSYYIPYINGYFASFGRFRSDDVKTGDLICLVGSTSSAAFFPTDVTLSDGSTYPIEARVYPAPNFSGTKPFAVQQGAGMAVLKSDAKTEEAAVTFLKWFTNEEQNAAFSSASGYLPVKKAVHTRQALESAMKQSNPIIQRTLDVGLDMMETYTLFTAKPFAGGGETRNILEKSLQEKAAGDRAQVLLRMAGGFSREEAVALYATDSNFQAWLKQLKRQLQIAAHLLRFEQRPRNMVD